MSDDEKIPPWRAPTNLDPALLDEDNRPKSKRVRRTKAQMAEAEARGEKVRRGIAAVKDRWPASMIDDLKVPVTIESLTAAAVPSLSPEAKARIIPQPTRINVMFMKWIMVGVWLGYRNVSLALPLCCIKVSW